MRRPSAIPGHRPSHARAAASCRGAVAAVLVLAAAASAPLARAQGESTLHESESAAGMRTPTEAALARDASTVAPMRVSDVFLFSYPGLLGATRPAGLRVSSGLYEPLRPFSLFDMQLDSQPSQPYLGLGYTHAWYRSGLSLDADLGMTSPSLGTVARARGLFTGSQSLDDTVRGLRLSPVMSVNVKLAF